MPSSFLSDRLPSPLIPNSSLCEAEYTTDERKGELIEDTDALVSLSRA